MSMSNELEWMERTYGKEEKEHLVNLWENSIKARDYVLGLAFTRINKLKKELEVFEAATRV